jgi:hypothetical protein
MAMFITEDGYKLFFQSQNLEGCRDDCDLRATGNSEVTRTTVPPGAIASRASGRWVDSLDPELQDNFWYGDDQGPWDVDSAQRLDGKLLNPEEEFDVAINFLSVDPKGPYGPQFLGSQHILWILDTMRAFKDNTAEKVKLLDKKNAAFGFWRKPGSSSKGSIEDIKNDDDT